MMTALGILLWLPAMLLRFALMLVGLVGVAFSLVADGAKRTPGIWRWCANVEAVPAAYTTSRWKKYYWMAIRNPLEGLDRLLKQPIPEIHPNPDTLVRSHKQTKATRFMRHGIFWEYWSLSAMKNGKFWEFRIGWKFVDGNEDFVPTFQLGPRNG